MMTVHALLDILDGEKGSVPGNTVNLYMAFVARRVVSSGKRKDGNEIYVYPYPAIVLGEVVWAALYSAVHLIGYEKAMADQTYPLARAKFHQLQNRNLVNGSDCAGSRLKFPG